jgi:hypothetical protein
MGIYSSDTDFSFVITGSGTKTLHYLMDNEEIYTETITNTNKLSHTFKIPFTSYGDHIFQVYADMEINNMTVESNILTAGMMFVDEHTVDTFILSTFVQKEETQGEVITIPYMVYNPFSENTEVNLNIYNEDNTLYSNQIIKVD